MESEAANINIKTEDESVGGYSLVENDSTSTLTSVNLQDIKQESVCDSITNIKHEDGNEFKMDSSITNLNEKTIGLDVLMEPSSDGDAMCDTYMYPTPVPVMLVINKFFDSKLCCSTITERSVSQSTTYVCPDVIPDNNSHVHAKRDTSLFSTCNVEYTFNTTNKSGQETVPPCSSVSSCSRHASSQHNQICMSSTNSSVLSCDYMDAVCAQKPDGVLTRIPSQRQTLVIHTDDVCNYCDKTFRHKNSLKTHIMIHTNERPYACSHCDKTFRDNSLLQRHMKIHVHSYEKHYSCSYCDKTFRQNSILQRHIRIHFDERPYSCSYCGKTFRQKGELPSHIMIHTNEKPYACSHCDKTFRQKSNLKKHIMIHTNDYPYFCSHCDKTFRVKAQLRNHIIIHSNERPYACSYCDKTFRRKDKLQGHLIIHTGERPYACSYCDKTFRRKNNLQSHLTIHTDEKPYACSYCDKRFRHKHAWQSHLMKIHKDHS